jgi:hypothetical protein
MSAVIEPIEGIGVGIAGEVRHAQRLGVFEDLAVFVGILAEMDDAETGQGDVVRGQQFLDLGGRFAGDVAGIDFDMGEPQVVLDGIEGFLEAHAPQRVALDAQRQAAKLVSSLRRRGDRATAGKSQAGQSGSAATKKSASGNVCRVEMHMLPP